MDIIRNEVKVQGTKVTEARRICRLIWQWVGHARGRTEGADMFYTGDYVKANLVQRPAASWTDDSRKVAGSRWMRVA